MNEFFKEIGYKAVFHLVLHNTTGPNDWIANGSNLGSLKRFDMNGNGVLRNVKKISLIESLALKSFH